ncbi:immunoglobulin-like domain-containing protein [Turicibacter sanguinis]|uniref:immunoglobulin-like domain-containing protein n=1 Tax=Turicibacter sanguinis TaxID=154288 RepID=UPI00294269AE|nr:immunoglobulin-like domain-containing protein [Turicibacter sanguinis]
MKQKIKCKITKIPIIVLFNLILIVLLIAISIVYTDREASSSINLLHGRIKINSEIKGFDSGAKNLSDLSEDTVLNSFNDLDSLNGDSLSDSTIIQATNYASLTGLNIKIEEGSIFNPLQDLKIKATDIDGTDITSKVTFNSGSVNINESGHYRISARVKLKDNTELIQTFSVEVLSKPLIVDISDIFLSSSEINVNESYDIQFNVESSKSSVVPRNIFINGTQYPVEKKANHQYFVSLIAPQEPSIETIVLNSLQMSDGTMIGINEVLTLTVLKHRPEISEFNSEIDSKTGKLTLTFKIIDINQSLDLQTPLTISLFDMQDREFQKEVKLSDMHKVVFKLPHNGSYRLKIFGHMNREHGTKYTETQLFEKELVIESIDKSILEGKDAIIKEGDVFNPFKQLKLKALDINGEDITSNIIIDGEVNTKNPGIYPVTVSVVTSNQKTIQKVFTVEVQKISTEIQINSFSPSVSNLVCGEEFSLLLDLTLSKDYVDIERVMLNQQEYLVQKLNQNLYQISLNAPQLNGSHELKLTRVVLSNGEEFEVNEITFINVMNIETHEESVDLFSTQQKSNLSDGIINRSSQSITGPANQQQNSQLKINGQVTSESNELPSGQLNVSLPSKVNFIVDQDGNLHGAANMLIKNNSLDVDISVTVASFLDSTPMGGITVINNNELKDKNRSFVSLSLVPSGGQDAKTVTLLSTGFIPSKLVDIKANSQVGLVLTGDAGKKTCNSLNEINQSIIDNDCTGVSDQFVLTFQIKKNN